jgi:hypothetical protein
MITASFKAQRREKTEAFMGNRSWDTITDMVNWYLNRI